MRGPFPFFIAVAALFTSCMAWRPTANGPASGIDHYRWTRKPLPAQRTVEGAATVESPDAPLLEAMDDIALPADTSVTEEPEAFASIERVLPVAEARPKRHRHLPPARLRTEPVLRTGNTSDIPHAERPMKKAVTAFVLSTVGLVGMFLSIGFMVLTIIGFVLGIVALIRIIQGRERGLFFAIAAILGILAVPFVIYVLLSLSP